MTPAAVAALETSLTERDVQILEDLERFRLLTTRQLQRMHFPAGPLGPHTSVSSGTRGTTRVLGRMEKLGVIGRLQRRIGGTRHGSALTIWQVEAAGDRLLRTRRGDLKRHRYLEPGLTFTDHQLAVNDVAVSLLEQAAAHRLDLLELDLEPTCWRSFSSATANMVVTVKPDLLVVTADASTETHSFIELDRGTAHLPAVVRKCATYQRYANTGIEQRARGLFPAVIWIVPGTTRQRQIQAAITADPSLDDHLFWAITPDRTLTTLAPYGNEITHQPKGGTP